MQILIVEDELALSNAIKRLLEQRGYFVDAVYDGRSAVDYAKAMSYSLIILDVMLPKLDGFEVVRELRADGIGTPILMLTARGATPDKVQGLNYGADDYMTKPFAPEELLARIKALTRRKGTVVPDETDFGDFRFNASTGELSKNGKTVRLNFKEAEIMKLLLAHSDSILPKEDIIVKVWGYDSDAGDNNVEAYISFLRRKLRFVQSSAEIKAVKKVGYRLEQQHDR